MNFHDAAGIFLDDNKFFKFIWRVNALAIAAILVLAAVTLFWQFLGKDVFGPRHVTDVVNVDPADETIVELRSISIDGRVAGAKLFRVSLNTEQEYDLGFSSKGSKGSVLNTGFYDLNTGTIQWLFPTQDQLITHVETLFTSRHENASLLAQKPVALGHFVSFIDQDTSGDKRLSPSDEISVLAIGPDGQGAKRILSGLIRAPRVQPLGGGKAVLFFDTSEGQHSAIFDWDEGTLGAEFTIALP
ncbi:hypothetical protein [Aliiroseovarius lamellibrachiae]|uniref:hypothetical protein n=1 Tax=Aliiroseovarius lamellibrachiae TaxID=1924933 RepID=UPI001BE09B4E|nr:hypothetical protein [Aliiroseovarius lamellibrachiae]MBT2130834.1 hypothetical protein [Aliiroseovarius lamellibrachiae]